LQDRILLFSRGRGQLLLFLQHRDALLCKGALLSQHLILLLSVSVPGGWRLQPKIRSKMRALLLQRTAAAAWPCPLKISSSLRRRRRGLHASADI
jgi:hypothetical protein